MNSRIARVAMLLLVGVVTGSLSACINTVTEQVPPESAWTVDTTMFRVIPPSPWMPR